MNILRIVKKEKIIIGAIAMIVLLVTLPKVNGQAWIEYPDQNNLDMQEDQVIICVLDLETDKKGDLNCHQYKDDLVDWYQDSRDGSFFSHDDSFEMVTVP